jgi:hypothetical protein
MRTRVLGRGLQGSPCAWDLSWTSNGEVTLADGRPDLLPVLTERGIEVQEASA